RPDREAGQAKEHDGVDRRADRVGRQRRTDPAVAAQPLVDDQVGQFGQSERGGGGQREARCGAGRAECGAGSDAGQHRGAAGGVVDPVADQQAQPGGGSTGGGGHAGPDRGQTVAGGQGGGGRRGGGGRGGRRDA